MADGFLGGIGDFFTGGGVYSDPKAINPTYGVPEGDVRQAAINQLGQMSALLLAAGQPMEGSQRAQLLSQIGNTGSQFNTNLYNSAQRRLMTAQMGEKQDELVRVQAMGQKVKDDPDGLAKSLGLPVDLIKTLPTKNLVELASQIAVKRATTEPGQAALAAAGVRAPPVAAQGGATAESAPTPIFSVPDPFVQSLDPAVRGVVSQYTTAINNLNKAGNSKDAADLADRLYKQVPGLKEAQVETAKTKAAEIAGAPGAYGAAVRTLQNIDAVISHPGREAATGGSAFMSYLPASQARDFANRVEQLGGTAFLEAYKELKGGGAISEAEGKKAEAAVARLKDRFISEGDYLKALQEYRDIVETGAKRTLQKLGGNVPEGYEPIPQAPSFNKPAQARPAQQRSFTGGARVISVE